MKKSLNDIFDEASAKDLDVLGISETDMPLPEGASLDRIKSRVFVKTGLSAPKKRPAKPRWQSLVALAASVCLVVGGAFGGVWFYKQNSVTPDIGEDIAYHMVADFLRDFAGKQIIWGSQGNSQDESPNIDPDGNEDPDRNPITPSVEYLVWNGLNVSKELYEALNSASDTDVFALKLVAMSEPEVKLSEFVYNGKSWAELSQESNEINGIVNALYLLKDLSISADHGYPSKEEIEEKMKEVAEVIEEMMKEVAYKIKEDTGDDFLPKYYKDGVFDNEKISDDLRDAENRKAQIKGEITDFMSAYNKKHKPNLSAGAWSKNYYVVVSNYGKYLIIDREQLSNVSKDTSLPSLENAAFILASQAELLRDEPDEPHLNVPTDEQPLPPETVIEEPLPDVEVENYVTEFDDCKDTDHPEETVKE